MYGKCELDFGTSAKQLSQGAGHPGEEDIGGLVLVGDSRFPQIATTLTSV